jgi:hypothetical protein
MIRRGKPDGFFSQTADRHRQDDVIEISAGID